MTLCLRQSLQQILLLSGVGLLVGCPFQTSQLKPAEISPLATSLQPQSYTTTAQLFAVGDIMMHGSQIRAGHDPVTATYRYDSFFTQVKNTLTEGDWVIGNLETPIASAELKYTGYPLFNAPDTLADALKTAGFNILTTANNHALDRGEAGVLQTLANIKQRNLNPVGTAASPEEAQNILVLEKNEIKMAILAYTYGTNGIAMPAGKDYLVSLINEPKIIQDILRAKQSADIVTVALHFGSEYQRQPNSEQKRLVASLVKAGADIVLGSHPHVVQPYEVFEFTDESGKPRKAVAIYSMGNFISNQRGDYRDLGVIFQVKLSKQFPAATTTITEIQTSPTWVHRYSASGSYQFRVLALFPLLTTQDDPLLSSQEYPRLQTYFDQINSHLRSLNPSQISTP
jgi:poly-gamma-glutamate capsule biosynthesis protein CapA/YwtB (metallophosphatase superfamily)